jgi:predicted LPLAT superfamily acyltransferase
LLSQRPGNLSVNDAAAPPAQPRPPQEWVSQPERGSAALHRAMTVLSLRCGRSLSRIVLFVVTVYFWIKPGAAAGHIRRFQRRALARRPTRRDLFSHLHAFATCTQDRIYLLNDRLADFSVDIPNEQLLRRMLEQRAGCFLMGAHLGSFEILRAVGEQYPGVKVAMVMYPENARKVGAALAAINPGHVPDIIPLGNIDAMLQVRARLDQGAFVGVLGDRTLGDEAVLSLNFLGSPAQFPLGPWRAAALLRRPVVFFAGVYCGGNRYRIVIEQLADFSETADSTREAAIHEAMIRYAGVLEDLCRSHPYNWFNFFDFWHELPAAKNL